MKKITINGRVPSKKNSKIMRCFGSRPMLLPSKNYKDWHKEASKSLVGTSKVENIESIKLTIYAPDRRAGDLTNKAESIMDLLVDNGVIEDDNWNVVPSVILCFGGVDKENPRVEIEIK